MHSCLQRLCMHAHTPLRPTHAAISAHVPISTRAVANCGQNYLPSDVHVACTWSACSEALHSRRACSWSVEIILWPCTFSINGPMATCCVQGSPRVSVALNRSRKIDDRVVLRWYLLMNLVGEGWPQDFASIGQPYVPYAGDSDPQLLCLFVMNTLPMCSAAQALWPH